MLFNSFSFILIFLPLVLIIYFLIFKNFNREHLKIFLILSSLFFYAYWKIEYIFLILFSIGVNFLFSKKIKENINKIIFFLQ